MENWWWNYCLGEISAKVILDKVPGKLRGKLVLGKVPDEMRGKLMLEQMPGEMRKKLVLEKVPGKIVLEKVPGKLRRKLRRKWQKKCHFWTQFSRFYVYWQNVAIYVLWCLLAKRRDLRTLPDTKFQLPDTFNYSAPLPVQGLPCMCTKKIPHKSPDQGAETCTKFYGHWFAPQFWIPLWKGSPAPRLLMHAGSILQGQQVPLCRATC